MGKQLSNRDANGRLKKEETSWDIELRQCTDLGRTCGSLVAKSGDIGTVLRNVNVMSQLTPPELQTVQQEATTALNLLRQYQWQVAAVDLEVKDIAGKPKRHRNEGDFLDTVLKYNELVGKYNDGILPTIMNVLELAELGENRLKAKVEK